MKHFPIYLAPVCVCSNSRGRRKGSRVILLINTRQRDEEFTQTRVAFQSAHAKCRVKVKLLNSLLQTKVSRLIRLLQR